MSNYVLGVVAHVSRKGWQDRLHDAGIFPDVVSEDVGTLGVTGNHLLVVRECFYQAQAGGADWVVVLEDDAQPVTGFHQQLSAALDVAPSEVVSLYNGSGYPAQYQHKFKTLTHRQDLCWILHPHMRHAVAYALHMKCFENGVIDTLNTFAQVEYPPDDALSKWCLRNGVPVAYANPSLVDHQDGPTVIKTRRHLGMVTNPGRRRPRHAHWVGTRLTWNGEYETA